MLKTISGFASLILLTSCQVPTAEITPQVFSNKIDIVNCKESGQLRNYRLIRDTSFFPFPEEIGSHGVYLNSDTTSIGLLYVPKETSPKKWLGCLYKISFRNGEVIRPTGVVGDKNWLSIASFAEITEYRKLLSACRRVPKSLAIDHFHGATRGQNDTEVSTNPEPSEFIGCDRIAQSQVVQFSVEATESFRISAVANKLFINGVQL